MDHYLVTLLAPGRTVCRGVDQPHCAYEEGDRAGLVDGSSRYLIPVPVATRHGLWGAAAECSALPLVLRREPGSRMGRVWACWVMNPVIHSV